jgi:hypothetical protein
MLDAIRILLIGATAGTLLATVVSTIRTSLLGRITVGAVAGAWVGLAAAVTAAGFGGSPLVLPLMFAVPLVIAALFALFSPGFRAATAGIPSTYIIGANVFRLMGVFFLVLAAQGRLSGPFPYFAGIGDVVTGLFALQVAGVAGRAPLSDPRILAWNAFGMLDLLNAVGLGILSSPTFPFQLIHAGVGSAAIGALPWSLVPLVLVPTYLMGHTIIFARALQLRENAVTT